MCATAEIWEAWWHVSRSELHARSCDVSRVTEVRICVREFNVKSPHTSQLHALTSHELTWREDSECRAHEMKNKRRATSRNRPTVTAVAACTSSYPASSLFLQQFSHTAESVFFSHLPFLVYGETPNSVLGRLIFFIFLDHTQLDTHTHTHTHTYIR